MHEYLPTTIDPAPSCRTCLYWQGFLRAVDSARCECEQSPRYGEITGAGDECGKWLDLPF